jgi:methyltransferase (TIGR00027 family)
VSEQRDASTQVVSRTCIYTAAGRAIGARDPDPSARNPDWLAEKLLGDPASLGVEHPAVSALALSYEEAMRDLEVVTSVRMMTVRTRFVDEALARAIGSGVTQIVILGAGFDSHAYRCEELLAVARVFEADRLPTQTLKRQRVLEALGRIPANLTYVPVDFERDDLGQVLTSHGYDAGLRTFFILEGVTMYLAEDAARSTLRFIASHPAGSIVVFDFVYGGVIDMIAAIDMDKVPAAARQFVQRFLDLTRDEPWIYGLPLDGEREFLAELGLHLREMFALSGADAVKRYLTRADGTQVGAAAVAEATARATAQRAAAAAEAPAGQPQMTPEQMRHQQRVMAYMLAEAVVP